MSIKEDDEKKKQLADSEEEKAFDFSSSYSDNFPQILAKLNISLAVTSYQSSRIFIIRSDGKSIDIHLSTFPRPMGVYADRERLTLGTFTQVMDFKRSDALLHKIKAGELDHEEKLTKKVLEKDKGQMVEFIKRRDEEIAKIKKADALYLPRIALTTGMINIHDIAWGNEGLWVVNSTFSCLATLAPDHSFVARWKPHFITDLAPEDRCHLNGMAMKDGKPKYVTTFNKFNDRDSWVESDSHDGTLMDVDLNKVLLDGLIMPHSPRFHAGHVYLCDSGTGRVLRYSPESGKVTTVIKLQGFPRGLNFYGSLMFVGLSKTRQSDTKKPIPISTEYEETLSGIWVVNLENNSEVAHIRFDGDVAQIYDVAVIPETCFPALLSNQNPLVRHTFDFRENMTL
ncbi:MAG: TIGR03032 family protein [Mariprofundaceae bacterium]